MQMKSLYNCSNDCNQFNQVEWVEPREICIIQLDWMARVMMNGFVTCPININRRGNAAIKTEANRILYRFDRQKIAYITPVNLLN